MAPRVYRNIDEIFAGDYEGMTPEEIAEKHPQAAYLRSMDKIGTGTREGNYFDLISRLEPCIQEMESYTEPVLVVSHQAILRLIFAYLTGVDRERAPGMNTFSQNVVYEITLDASCEDLITEGVGGRFRPRRRADFRRDVETLAKISDPAERGIHSRHRSRSRERVSVPSFHRLILWYINQRQRRRLCRVAPHTSTSRDDVRHPPCRRRRPTRRPRPLPREASARSSRKRFVAAGEAISDFSPATAQGGARLSPAAGDARASHRRSRRVRRLIGSSRTMRSTRTRSPRSPLARVCAR